MSITLSGKKPAEPQYIDGTTGEAVYVVHGVYGNKQVRVPQGTPVVFEDTRASYHDRASQNPRDVMPNIEVRDGALVIPIVDMLDEILSRADPVELAEALWTNDEVRERFIECMSRQYASDHFSIKDRFKFLRDVKEAIHDEHQQKLMSSLVSLESEACRVAYNQYLRVNYTRYHRAVMETLQSLDPDIHHKIITAHGDNPFANIPNDEAELHSTGKHWHEAREYWRKVICETFKFDIPKELENDGNTVL